VQWQQALPAHIPSGRFNHAMTYDLGSGCALVHGGRSVGSSLLGDTWGWNGIDWILLAANGPSARYHHAMCFDLQRTRTVLFGGRDTMDLADTWEWDGAQWLQPTTGGPTPRNGHALVYDLARAVTVLHGGSQGGDETWEWDGNHWALVASGATLRRDHAMVFDARLQRATLFGGVLSTRVRRVLGRDELRHAAAGFVPVGRRELRRRQRYAAARAVHCQPRRPRPW
jgi:hypothetical protein